MFLLLWGALVPAGFAQEIAEQPAPPPAEKLLFPALGSTLFSNAALAGFNRYVTRLGFARPTMKDIKENLVDGWEWDRDEFPTNMFAHPYHGSTYFAAGRASGFNFYESFVFSFLGALTWEFFAEITRPSMNDLIMSSFGGGMLGEMLHRLYLEISSPLGALVSPLDSFTNLISFRRPEKTGGKNIYRLAVSTGPGWLYSEKYNLNNYRLLDVWNTPVITLDCNIIYGNPFEQRSWIPYEQFEFNVGGGLGIDWWNMYIISDGYLFSFSPVNNAVDKASTGLSLNYDFYTSVYDFFGSSNINLTSLGLDWTVKYQHFFDGDSRMELKAHAGLTLFGGSMFYNQYMKGKDRTVYPDYGYGGNAKVFFSYFNPLGQRLDIELMLYGLYTISYYSPERAGGELCGFFNASYTIPLGKNFSVGVGDSVAGKLGLYQKVPGIGMWTNTIKLFAQWNFFQKI